MMRRKSYAGLLALVMVVAGASSAVAQEFRATIRGQILDTSKAALPGATVTVQNTETNELATATTNAEGNFSLPFLRPGSYTLTVELTGFQKYTRTGMRLQVNETATLNVELGVGLTENVNVTAESPLLETSNASRGTVIDSARIAELPLQSRSPMALAVLVAGVTYNAQAVYLRPFDNGALADWSMNGGSNRNNEFLLDGAPNNANQSGNNIAYVPPAEAVQEMKISTNSYDAQYGRTAGGVVNMSLKSGTNSFHGVGYDFMRRKALAANSFLLNSRNAPKTDQYIDQYGFSVDGPMFKNKTFFLFTGEKYREGTPAPLFGAVPTPAFKNGDFSGLVDAQGNLIRIYDPNTGRDVNGVWTRDQFPGNRIPANRINPTARAIMQYWPEPNNVDPSVAPWQRNLAWAEHFNKDLFWNWVGKVDHNFGANDRAFFRWGENERNEIGNRGTNAIRSGPGQGGQLPLWRANRALVGDWVHIFGAGTVFNLRASYTYFLEWSYSDHAIGFDSTEFWPASLVQQFPSQDIGGIFPVVQVDQFITLSRGSAPNRNRNYTVQPNVSLTRGAHNIRGGLDMRWTNVFNENYNNSGGNLDFTRQFTRSTLNSNSALEGNAFASFLLGAPNTATVDVNPKPHYQWLFMAPWIQDDWRVTNKLTLNLGFRWDINGSVTEEDNMLNYAFDPTIVNPVSARVGQQVMGGIRFAGVDGAPDRPWKLDKDNWQGRVGFAYSINDKTVLRGGYGKYFLNPTGQGNNAGFSQSTNLIASTDGGRTPTYALSNPWPNGIQTPPGSSLGPQTFLGRGPAFSNPDFVVPNVHQFSVGVQRELPWRISLDMTYAGSRSYDLEAGRAFNDAPADFQRLCDVTQGGSRSFCDQLVANPFFNVPGFEGTTRFTNPTIARSELARPFPAFGGFNQNQLNVGKLTYDSAQFVANKRWAKGVTVNASYTYVPRWTEVGGYVDSVSGLLNEGPYFSQRKHRVTASAVWELPWHRGERSLMGYLVGGWSIAPLLVYQSGQPWDMPGNVELAPGVNLADVALPGEKDGQFIYGVKPCIGQRNATTGQYTLLAVSTAYGCTEPYFLIRENFQRRTAMNRYDEFRRPGMYQVDVNFAKMTPITDNIRLQVRLEAFNVFNSPMYDERQYNQDTNSADFGRINRNVTGQNNFQRFIQLGFRLIF
jgi:Carboxypeptidase regulatory-like domain/TonB dependent receptor/TonB-dependent Receptor Plug Domain